MHRTNWKHLRIAAPAALLLSLACAPSQPPPEAPFEAPALESVLSSSSGEPGDVVSYRRTRLPLINAKAWLVLYRSTDALDRPNSVSGTVLVPNSAWTGGGPRPIIAFAHETVGITDNCAPSKSLASGLYLEAGSVQKALAKGWAVALTDYEGLGTPGTHTYCAAKSEAHAVLDSVRAAVRTPGSGLDINAPVGIWGYSQGGGAAGAAAELAPSYAPELNVKGVAAGGAVADLTEVFENSNGSLYFGFMFSGLLGLDTAYPELNLESYLNAAGKRELSAIAAGTKSACILDLVFNYPFKHLSDYTTSDPLQTPAWQQRLAENKVGMIKPAVPALVYHGDIDEIIPNSVGAGLRDRWCALGATVKWAVYPFGEHLFAQSLAIDDVLQWLGDRFDGKPAPSTCPR